MTTDASTSHLSNVWFQVTGLDVASGDGSWVTSRPQPQPRGPRSGARSHQTNAQAEPNMGQLI